MHICMIVGEFPPHCGGIGYYVYNLSKNLAERGYKITVLTRGNWNQKCIIENLGNITIYRTRFIPFYPFHIELYSKFLERTFKNLEEEFDIVHFHNPLVPFINTKVPTLLTEHGTVKAPIDNMEELGIHSYLNKLFAKKFIDLDINIIKNVNNLTAVSKSCAEDINNFYNLKKEIEIVYNGVDTEFFRPKMKTKIDPYVLYTGRLYAGKGLLDLIKSAKFVCNELPDIKFVLAGDGPLKKQLIKEINKLNLQNNFLLTGFLSREKILETYQNANVYVLPSHSEGFPTTLLEAMSCGIASISSDIGGCSELIENFKNGVLVPPKNPKILANAIIKLLNNDKLRFELGDTARNDIVENYDWKSITNKFDYIYNTIGVI